MVYVIAGGTGLIGSRLTELLHNSGHTVRILTRHPRGEGQFAWNPDAGSLDDAALSGANVVVNLAGAGIADGRWTASRKKELVDSRVNSARTLRQAFERTGFRPSAYVSASAIGIYGNTGETVLHEDTPPQGPGFMIDCCEAWEKAADEVAALGIRTVKLRIGVVLAQEGGALAEFVKPLRFGVGGYFGNGRAWYSWIHRDDVCRLLIWAAEQPAAVGVFNAVAPQPARLLDLVKATARAMGRRWTLFAPAPEWVMRLALGEMSAVILNSNLVSADKVQQAGFRFEYPDLSSALTAVFK